MQINLEVINPYQNSTYLIREYMQTSFTSPRHYHHQFELTYINESYGKLYIGNSIADFKKGELFLFAPRLIHCFKNPKGYEDNKELAKATCIFFMKDFLGDVLLNSMESKMLNLLLQKSELGLKFPNPAPDLIDLLISIISAENLNGLINLLIILNKLSLQKNAIVLSDTLLIKYYYKHAKDNRIDKIIDYVSRNYQNKMTVKEIANMVNMSEAGFSRYFKSRTDLTFTKFMNEVRISRSQKLLIETSKSIQGVSQECGYDNLSYFNRQFKLHNHLSPKVFREYFINTGSEVL